MAKAKYLRDELLVNAEALFGVKPEVVVGALYGNSEDSFTVDELQKLIEDFLQRKVNE